MDATDPADISSCWSCGRVTKVVQIAHGKQHLVGCVRCILLLKSNSAGNRTIIAAEINLLLDCLCFSMNYSFSQTTPASKGNVWPSVPSHGKLSSIHTLIKLAALQAFHDEVQAMVTLVNVEQPANVRMVDLGRA